MPGRQYTGGGSFYHHSGTITRSIRPPHNTRDHPLQQKYDAWEATERSLNSYLAEDENFPSFRAQLGRVGLQLRDIPADGNCLFRALGDQLEGHSRNHFRHRSDVVNFMRSHRYDFEPFVEDDMSFDDHVKTLQKLGTHAGNDAIVAFAKLHNVNVIIHQLNGRPLMIQGPVAKSGNVQQLHLSYHNGDHYSSVRKIDDNTESPANVCFMDQEPEIRAFQKRTRHVAVGPVSAKRGLEDIEAEVATVTNCQDIEKVRQVLLECDYDVDASIADLLKHMKLNRELQQQDDSDSFTRPQKFSTINNGIFHSSATSSNCNSPNSNSSRIAGSVLKSNGHSYANANGHANGNGHKVHFREDSFGSSSGFESLNGHNGGGVRPKVNAIHQFSERTLKDPKKMDKRKQENDRRKERLLEGHPTNPQVKGVRDVTVVGLHNDRVTRF